MPNLEGLSNLTQMLLGTGQEWRQIVVFRLKLALLMVIVTHSGHDS